MSNVTGNVTWIKLYLNIFDVGKLPVISSMQDGATLELLWIKLLVLAGQSNNGGYLYVADSIPFDKKSLANRCKVREKLMENALKIFKNFGMIEEENGVFLIKNWAEYQNVDGMEKVREQTRKRVSAYRDRRKAENDVTGCNVTCNVTVTECNATEEDKEEDKEKNKNNINILAPSNDDWLPSDSPTEVASSKKKKEEPVDETPVVIQLMLNDKSMYDIHQSQVDEWTKLYPAVDVMQELRNMVGWIQGNPTKRKTKSGILRFANTWLSKAQNSGRQSFGKPINSVADVDKIKKDNPNADLNRRLKEMFCKGGEAG